MTVELAPARIGRRERTPGQKRKFEIRSLRKQFTQGSMGEIACFTDNLFAQIKEKSPKITLYDLMKKAVDMSPQNIPLQVKEKAMQAIVSEDANTKALGKKVFLFLNIKTLLSAVDSFYFAEIDSPQDRDEMLTWAIVQLMEKADKGMIVNSSISSNINNTAKTGIAKFLEKKDSLPVGLIRNLQDRRLVLDVREEIESELLTNGSIESLANKLCEHAGFVGEDKKKEILNWLMFLNAGRKEERKKALLEQEEDAYFTEKPELKKQMKEILNTLKPKEKKVIKLRFGFEESPEELTPEQEGPTLEQVGKEFGVTRERIRQIEVKALRKLRHPSRSAKLRPYSQGVRQEDFEIPIDLSTKALRLNKTEIELLTKSGIREIGDFFSASPEEIAQEWLGEPRELTSIMRGHLMPIINSIYNKLKGNERLLRQERAIFTQVTDSIQYRHGGKSAIGNNSEERVRIYEKARENMKVFSEKRFRHFP